MYRFVLANPPAELDFHVIADGIGDSADRAFVLGTPGGRSVQIHDVQPARTLFQPVLGHCRRIVGKNRHIAHRPLSEAYTLSIFEVNGWDDQHRLKALRGPNGRPSRTWGG